MRVLVVHNRYRSGLPSGENLVVDQEIDLLRSGGHDVEVMFEESDSINGLSGIAQAAFGPVYAPAGMRRARRLLREFMPDVVHVQNVFPLISPSVVALAAREGVPVVHTVHNFRHTCVNGLHFRDGHTCTDCVGKRLPWPAVEHACYRGSRVQSVPMALSQVVHRTTWRVEVARVVALTRFVADRLVAAGFPAERVVVRPGWVEDPGGSPVTGRDLLYAGRLEEAKGVLLLLEAWSTADDHEGRRLRIIGDGDLRGAVEAAARADPSISVFGSLPREAVIDHIRETAAVLMPSLAFEGYPLVIAEARSIGRAVVTVSGGSPASIVTPDSGWVCEPSAVNLIRTLRGLTDRELAIRGEQARRRYEFDNSPTAALRSLEDIYAEAVAMGTHRGGPGGTTPTREDPLDLQ